MKLLVVHGQGSILKSIKNLLRESLPYIRSYRSGLGGKMAAGIESYDLVICGTQLPVVTGFEMIRSIRMSARYADVRKQKSGINSSSPLVRIEGSTL